MDENIVAEEQVQQVALQSEPQTNEVVSQEVVASAVTVGVDVDKTLYDAEEFLANFAGLRLENDQLKRSNEELQQQLEKARHDLQQMQLEKSSLEAVLIKEREQHKEALWKVKSEFQKIQEERLQWKEKYLNICMRNGNTTEPIQPGRKRKLLTAENENEEFYTNLAATFGLAGQEEQPVPPITNQLWDPETKRFECKECKATFRMFSELKAHIDKNKCVKYTFQCPQCSVVFSNAASFTKHLKYHIGKNIRCDFCGEKFMHDKGLQRHIKMYHTEFSQRFQCQYCSKLFNRKTLLENHIRRHFDYRPFKCTQCDKAFKTKQYLTGHINGVHKNDKQFVCDKCDARFSWRTTWKRHVQGHILKANKKKNKNRAGTLQNTVAAATATLTVQQPQTQTVVTMPLQTQLATNVVQLTHEVPQLTAENLAATLDHTDLTQNAYVQLAQTVQQLTHHQPPGLQ